MTQGKVRKKAGGCAAAAPAPSRALSLSRETSESRTAASPVRTTRIQKNLSPAMPGNTTQLEDEVDKFAKDMSRESPKNRVAAAAQPPGNDSTDTQAQVAACAKPTGKEIRFYESGVMMAKEHEAAKTSFPKSILKAKDRMRFCWGWAETEKAIERGTAFIVTNQMGLLSTDLLQKGYSIFVYPAEDDSYEIKLGSNTCTEKHIRIAHNLFKMWAAGAFSANT